MGINIISKSTSEREKEIKDLFELIKPYLDDGWNYSNACMHVKNLNRRPTRNNGWFRDVVEYGERQGYSYNKYSGHIIKGWKR